MGGPRDPQLSLPAAVRAGVEPALEAAFGARGRTVRATSVGGGCISPAARIETEGGSAAFLKWGAPTGAPPGAFAAEARSLVALAQAGAVRVPRVLGVFDPVTEPGGAAGASLLGTPWLLLEWLEPGRPTPATWRGLGSGLAQLHRARAELYGWPEDNFIGPLAQLNGALPAWSNFWRERRLEPQLRRAYTAGAFQAAARRRFSRLLDRLDELLAGAERDGASLLHGDLWSGNVHVLVDGSAALVDPATYYGHREVDLAMSELFGGFGVEFYRAYDAAWPVDEAYKAVRRGVYQLYYLLVHVNVFGGGYVESTVAALERVPL